MDDKSLSNTEVTTSVKRIEYLLEEMIFQQILARENNNVELANEKLKIALANVADSLQLYFDTLPQAK